MTALGLFLWCMGAAILADRIFSLWSTLEPSWSNKRKWFELALIFIGSTLIIVGTVLQIKGL